MMNFDIVVPIEMRDEITDELGLDCAEYEAKS
jgi:hypothetical protein